jgi:hypothetical protein
MASAFICHRGTDVDKARLLASDLLSRGHKIWLDTWQIKIGDSVIRKMNEGLTHLKYLVLCYSDAGLTSGWMNAEWMSTLHRQLSGVDVKILPVRLTGGSPPAILADIKYADLVTDWPSGVDALSAAMV